ATKPAGHTAQQRRVTATASKCRAGGRLKACQRQYLQPAYQEVERLARKWTDHSNDLTVAKESARRTGEIGCRVEQLFRDAQDRAQRARVAHEVALDELTFPRIDCDYGALLAAEQATRHAKHVTRCSGDNARQKMEQAMAAVKLAAGRVDVESFKRSCLDKEVSAANRRYAEVKN
ncbi:unnamed protein product, partial [Pylaiella littoralis]